MSADREIAIVRLCANGDIILAHPNGSITICAGQLTIKGRDVEAVWTKDGINLREAER